MFCIAPTNKIILTKGDSAEIDVRVFDKEGKEVEILPSDIITLTVKQSATSLPVLHKTAELNSIFLRYEDTADIPAGLYVYDIDFCRDGERQTIIPENLFELRGAI